MSGGQDQGKLLYSLINAHSFLGLVLYILNVNEGYVILNYLVCRDDNRGRGGGCVSFFLSFFFFLLHFSVCMFYFN